MKFCFCNVVVAVFFSFLCLNCKSCDDVADDDVADDDGNEYDEFSYKT